MRIKALIIAAVLLMYGCGTATLTSRDLVLDLRASQSVPIGVTMDRIDTSKTGNTGTYVNSRNDLYATLLSESKGTVREYKDQPLLLSIAFRFTPEFDANPVIGIPSFFLPFLAFVSEENNEEYVVDYTVTDRSGAMVHGRTFRGSAAGSITGYFIGRLDAAQKLREKEGRYAAQNAARHVLRDLDEQMETLVAAVHGPRVAGVPLPPPAASSMPAEPAVRTDQPSAAASAAYEEAKQAHTYTAYADFLNNFPATTLRKEALAAMARIVGTPKGAYGAYKKFVNEFPDGIEHVPQDMQLLLAGPEGMRVHDILGLLRQGIDDTVIAAKIRMQNGIYRDFSFKEISALKKKGVPACIVEAMLDATNRAKREQEERQRKDEMETLLADIQRAQKRLDELKTAQAQPAQTASQEGGNTLSDTVKNCAAQVAALEACKQLPGLAQVVCKAAAKSKFPCD